MNAQRQPLVLDSPPLYRAQSGLEFNTNFPQDAPCGLGGWFHEARAFPFHLETVIAGVKYPF